VSGRSKSFPPEGSHSLLGDRSTARARLDTRRSDRHVAAPALRPRCVHGCGGRRDREAPPKRTQAPPAKTLSLPRPARHLRQRARPHLLQVWPAGVVSELVGAGAHTNSDGALTRCGQRLAQAIAEARETRTACAFCPSFEHVGAAWEGREAFARHARGKRHRGRLANRVLTNGLAQAEITQHEPDPERAENPANGALERTRRYALLQASENQLF
jgi:hypothetical protein